ncbi:hypothetical protein SSUST1_1825 [Streptococcus suis ST1]|nr:hypothetical protein SSUST1_1825 [Streptococcus suis ST1]
MHFRSCFIVKRRLGSSPAPLLRVHVNISAQWLIGRFVRVLHSKSDLINCAGVGRRTLFRQVEFFPTPISKLIYHNPFLHILPLLSIKSYNTDTDRSSSFPLGRFVRVLHSKSDLINCAGVGRRTLFRQVEFFPTPISKLIYHNPFLHILPLLSIKSYNTDTSILIHRVDK